MGERVPRVVKIHPTATSPTADSGFGFKLIGEISLLSMHKRDVFPSAPLAQCCGCSLCHSVGRPQGGIPILVESVVPGSRAETAGLLPGELAAAFDGVCNCLCMVLVCGGRMSVSV
jgi:hypothetical protein